MAKFSSGEIAIIWNPKPNTGVMGNTGHFDTSRFHGEECTIEFVNPPQHPDADYLILVGEDNECWYISESELKKKYDGDEVTAWDQCEWCPTEDLVTQSSHNHESP